MQKLRDAKISSFEFSDLKGTHVISQSELRPFEFKTLSGESVTRKTSSDETLRLERGFEKKGNFRIDEVVRDSRGHARQEQSDLELRIQSEVKRRLEALQKEAFEQGLEEGRAEGKQQAYAEHQELLAAQTGAFSQVIEAVKQTSGDLLEANKAEVYEFVKRFTKWIVLKEVDSKAYLEDLLEKLILEQGARKNLIVKVGKKNFKDMPEIIRQVEARLGQLSNVRVEIVPELKQPGIVLESENGLIDGSLESVFKNIDKVFEQVVSRAGPE